MKKNNWLRVGFDLFVIAIISMILIIIENNSMDLGQLGIVLLIPLKLSFATLTWFVFRKTMFYYLPPTDWSKPYKEWRLLDVFTIVSYIVIVFAWTSYS